MLKLLLIFTTIILADSTNEKERFRDLSKEDYLNLYTSKENNVYYWNYPNEMVDDENLGYKHVANTSVSQVARTKDEILFDADYNFDEFSRRINLEKPKDSQNKFLILSGCSFVYGNGLNDQDTLNNIINKKSENFYSYNYGIGGTGTNSVLGLIEENKFKKQIDFSKGAFVYVYLRAHIYRSNGVLPSLSWLRSTPFYEKNNSHELVRKGNFLTGRPFETKFLLGLQKLIEYLPVNQFRIFPPINSEEINYTCDLVQKAKVEFKKQFPSSDFYVYIHGFHKGPEEFRKCLISQGVDVIDGQIGPEPQYVIKYDGHPNELANKVVAREILQVLENTEN